MAAVNNVRCLLYCEPCDRTRGCLAHGVHLSPALDGSLHYSSNEDNMDGKVISICRSNMQNAALALQLHAYQISLIDCWSSTFFRSRWLLAFAEKLAPHSSP